MAKNALLLRSSTRIPNMSVRKKIRSCKHQCLPTLMAKVNCLPKKGNSNMNKSNSSACRKPEKKNNARLKCSTGEFLRPSLWLKPNSRNSKLWRHACKRGENSRYSNSSDKNKTSKRSKRLWELRGPAASWALELHSPLEVHQEVLMFRDQQSIIQTKVQITIMSRINHTETMKGQCLSQSILVNIINRTQRMQNSRDKSK